MIPILVVEDDRFSSVKRHSQVTADVPSIEDVISVSKIGATAVQMEQSFGNGSK
jgi:hypothetical protein